MGFPSLSRTVASRRIRSTPDLNVCGDWPCCAEPTGPETDSSSNASTIIGGFMETPRLRLAGDRIVGAIACPSRPISSLRFYLRLTLRESIRFKVVEDRAHVRGGGFHLERDIKSRPPTFGLSVLRCGQVHFDMPSHLGNHISLKI